MGPVFDDTGMRASKMEELAGTRVFRLSQKKIFNTGTCPPHCTNTHVGSVKGFLPIFLRTTKPIALICNFLSSADMAAVRII